MFDAHTVIAGRFEIIHQEGVGGMGSVYRAVDLTCGATVAVKVLRSRRAEDYARNDREAMILAALSHPGVVGYVSHGETSSGERYLVMEWLDGVSLAAWMARGKHTVPEILSVMLSLAESLAVVHRAGVVHRDVTPSNVILRAGALDRATLMDFGLAHGFDEAPIGHTLGRPMGTPGYMAPEQVRGEPCIDARADVFSLGCVLHECITGGRPFRAVHHVATMARSLLETPPRLRSVAPHTPDALDALAVSMLSMSPNDRPEDGTEVAVALSDIVRGLRPRARAPRGVSPDAPAVAFAGAGTPETPAGTETWFRAADTRGATLAALGRYDALRGLITRIASQPAAPTARVVQLRVLCRLGIALTSEGSPEALDGLMTALEGLAAGHGPTDMELSGLLHRLYAARALQAGDPVTCVAGLKAAVAAQVQAGLLDDSGDTRCALGAVLTAYGFHGRAEASLRAGIGIATARRLPSLAAVARLHLANTLGCVHRYDESVEAGLASLAALEEIRIGLSESVDRPLISGVVRVHLATSMLGRGDAVMAERYASDGRALLANYPLLQGTAMAALSRALLARGKIDAASAIAEAAVTRSAAVLDGAPAAALQNAWAETCMARGDTETAIAIVRSTLDWLYGSAAKMRPSAWRSGYLLRVPENARTIEIARRLDCAELEVRRSVAAPAA